MKFNCFFQYFFINYWKEAIHSFFFRYLSFKMINSPNSKTTIPCLEKVSLLPPIFLLIFFNPYVFDIFRVFFTQKIDPPQALEGVGPPMIHPEFSVLRH